MGQKDLIAIKKGVTVCFQFNWFENQVEILFKILQNSVNVIEFRYHIRTLLDRKSQNN